MLTSNLPTPYRLLALLIATTTLAACVAPATTPAPTQPPAATATMAPTAAPTAEPAPALPNGRRIVGYYASWAPERGVFPASLNASQLTHINYAFGNVSADDKCILGDPKADTQRVYSAAESVSGQADLTDPNALHGTFNQFLQLKQKYPSLQILISVGGWSWSDKFSDAALTDSSRQAFAKSCVDLYLKQYKGVFDGIDIDWEYPGGGGLTNAGRPEDKQNFNLLLAELRHQLDQQGAADGRHYLLTIAAPAGGIANSNYDRATFIKSLDFLNLMAYDIHGTWESATGFNASLYQSTADQDASANDNAAVQDYLKAGVPADKLVLGVPFYGHGWQGVPAADNGLGQVTTKGGAPGSYGEEGAFDYKDLKQNYFATYGRFWDPNAQVPWLYSADTGIFISYDDPASLDAKAAYVNDQKLGGIMIWELSQDDGSLLNAIFTRLSTGQSVSLDPTPTPLAAITGLADATVAAPGHVAGSPRPFEAQIHSVSNIKIDGKLSDWPKDPTFTLNDKSHLVYSLAPDSWSGPADLSAKAWAGWSSDGLYFAFNVTDDKHVQTSTGAAIWHGDYVELQVDTQLEKDYDETGMNDDDYQIGVSPGDFAKVLPESTVWFGPTTDSALKAVQQAAVKTATGYTLEVFIPKELLQGITLSDGATLGLNLNPSDTDNGQEGQKAMLSTSPTRTLTDPTTFGKITLVK